MTSCSANEVCPIYVVFTHSVRSVIISVTSSVWDWYYFAVSINNRIPNRLRAETVCFVTRSTTDCRMYVCALYFDVTFQKFHEFL